MTIVLETACGCQKMIGVPDNYKPWHEVVLFCPLAFKFNEPECLLTEEAIPIKIRRFEYRGHICLLGFLVYEEVL